MRGVWIDQNQDPLYDKLRQYGITVPFFDPRDPRITSSYLDGVKARPGITACGIYTAWNWDTSFSNPITYATWTDLQLRRIGWPGNPLVILDIEKGHGLNENNYVAYVLEVLKRWRELRPSRPTWFTLEGMQGGLFSSENAKAVQAAKVRLAPQMFTGDMTAHGHDVTIDLLIPGFRGDVMDGMYDAAALPYQWRGVAFTQGRLP